MKRLVLGAWLLAVLALPGPAGARPHPPPTYGFRVVYEGVGSYGIDSTTPSEHTLASAEFNWRVVYKLLTLPKAPDRNPISTVTKPRRSTASGSWAVSSSGESGPCSRSGALSLDRQQLGSLEGGHTKDGFSFIAGTGPLKTGVPDSGDLCNGSRFWSDWPIGVSDAAAWDTGYAFADPLGSVVTIPNSELGRRKIVVETASATRGSPYLPPQSNCGDGEIYICSQRFDWTGRITLTKAKLPHGR
jgi:hypothetical protein